MNYSIRSMRSGFSLVELLVVIAIIGLITAVLLPGLAKARDTAREARCMANMRQVVISASAFRADHGAIMPNSVLYRYQNGFIAANYRPSSTAPVQTRWMPSDGGNMVLFPHLLIQGRYLPDSRVPANAAQALRIARSKASVFYCPNMFSGRPGEYDTRSYATSNKINNDIERRSGHYWADNNGNGTTTSPRLDNGYSINELAGGQGLNMIISAAQVSNRGFYKRKNWNSPEDRVGYLFENFMWTTGGVSQYVDSIVTSSSMSFGGYGPPIRHNNYTSTNLIYADGHGVKFPTPAFPTVMAISDPAYPVSMVFQ